RRFAKPPQIRLPKEEMMLWASRSVERRHGAALTAGGGWAMVRSPQSESRRGREATSRRGSRRTRRSQGREARVMAMITDAPLALETEVEGLAFAREVLRIEAQALERVRDQLGLSIARAADLIYRCPGSVIVTGMGKA